MMPWWVWLLVGLVTGGVFAYVGLMLYLGKAFRR